MNVKTITAILDRNGIPYLIQGGRVLADSMLAFTPVFSETVDVTGWTVKQLYSWLGY